MASNTTRLGLLKKDPVTEGTQTFNIKTMMNDNWDILDEKVAILDPLTGKVPADQLEIDTSNLATKQELTTHMAEKASTTGYGHTILNPTTTSTSHSEAATAGAVKAVADIANTKAPASHSHTIGQVTGLQSELDSKIPKSSINQPGGVVGIGSDGVPQVAPKKTKLFEINLAQNPSVVVSINNLSNYKDFTLVIKNVVNTHASTNELQVRVNGLSLTTDYMGYNIVAGTLNSVAKTAIATIIGIINGGSVSGTLEIESVNSITGVSFLQNVGNDGKVQSFSKNEQTLRDTNSKIVNSLQIDYKNASTTMNSGIIELWGNPR